MPDIFNKRIVPKSGPLARAETMILQVNGGTVSLAQSVTINYQQQLQPVFELGTYHSYMVSGRTNGSVGMARVVGSADALAGSGISGKTARAVFPTPFWEVDGGKGGEMVLRDTETDVEYLCSGCYIQNATVSAEANGSVIMEQVQMLIQSLQIRPGNP